MDVGGWLRSLGLAQYEPMFRAHEIDSEVLPELSEGDLEKLGIPLGHRKRLMKAIALIGGPTMAPASKISAPIEPSPRESAERRHLTVMFCDLVGSTALSTKLDPEDLRVVIGAYHKCVAATVAQFDGFVAKYMGDGVLIYFGYPQAHEDDAERSVRTGLALITAMSALQSPVPLQVRVGIATGLVVVGDMIGSGEAQERGIVGETPNLAARLQGVAEANMVVIAEGTRRLLGNLFELEELGPKDLKGIAGPARAWAALRTSSVESRFEAMHASGLTALVGREEETELLLRRWSRAKSGEGQVVLLSGEAGIGKSRLTAALLEQLAGEPHTRLRYFCSPQHTDSALYPIIGQMERAAGLTHDDKPQAKLDKLEALLAQTSTSIEDAALFAEMLSLPNDGRYPALALVPEQRRQRTLDALMAQMQALTHSSPVLMILEDAHWTDPTTLELFGRVVERIWTLRVLLIVTFRPEFEAPWIGRPHVTALTINRLAQRDIDAMIDRLVGNASLPANIRQDIIERTDGIPLFVEEMTKAVLEAENDSAAEHVAAAVPHPGLAVPASLHASLMARLDRLGPAKEVAQVGAAIGREFSHALLAAVVSKPEAELASALDRLVEAGLLFRQGVPPHTTYLFKHALVQDAAYGTLLREPRRALHAAIARALTERFPERAAAQPELVAHHFTEAALPAEAVGYWLQAGRWSAERSADKESVRQLRRGLDALMTLSPSPNRNRKELEFQLALGTPLISLHGWSGSPVATAYERAGALCEGLNDAERLSPNSFWDSSSNRIVRGETRAAQHLTGQLHVLAERTGDRVSRLLAHRATGAVMMQLGEFIKARSEFEQIGAIYDSERDRSLAARCVTDPQASGLSFLSLVLWILGYPEQARRAASEASRWAADLGHANTRGHILCHGGAQLAQLLRDVRKTRAHADALIALAGEHDMPMWRGYGTVFQGWAIAEDGSVGNGAHLVRQGMEDLGGTRDCIPPLSASRDTRRNTGPAR